MTVRGLLLALALVASAPVETAAACHRYSIWKYPTPQRCSVVALVRHPHLRMPSRPVTTTPDLPLPFLEPGELAGGEADEWTRGRLMLRAALQNRR